MNVFAAAADPAAAAASANALAFNWTISLGDIAQAASLPLALWVAYATIKAALKNQKTDLAEHDRLQREAFENSAKLQQSAFDENARLQREVLDKTIAEHRMLTS